LEGRVSGAEGTAFTAQEDAEQQEAALRIQAVARGRNARAGLQEKREAKLEAKRGAECEAESEERASSKAEAKRENEEAAAERRDALAATRIQAASRGKAARQQVKNMHAGNRE
jgi:hypothetical protein